MLPKENDLSLAGNRRGLGPGNHAPGVGFDDLGGWRVLGRRNFRCTGNPGENQGKNPQGAEPNRVET